MRQKSQNLTIRFLTLVFSVFVFSSCSLVSSLLNPRSTSMTSTAREGLEPCEISSKNSNSNFIVGQVEAQVNIPAITLKEEGLIQKFSLNLKAQLRDGLAPDSVIPAGTSFYIKYYKNAKDRTQEKWTVERVVSDDNGYIQWEEEYDYQYKLRPSWVVLKRHITGSDENRRYQGVEIVNMAVNPWLSNRDKATGEPAILDIRCEHSWNNSRKKDFIKEDGLIYLSKTKRSSGEGDAGPEERPLLWAPSVNIQVQEKNSSEDNVLETQYNQKKAHKNALLLRYTTLIGFGLEHLSPLSVQELENREKEIEKEIKDTGLSIYSLSIQELVDQDKNLVQQIKAFESVFPQVGLAKQNQAPIGLSLESHLENLETYLKGNNTSKQLNREQKKQVQAYIAIKKAKERQFIIEYIKVKKAEEQALSAFLHSLQNTCERENQEACYKRYFSMSFIVNNLQYRYIDRSGVVEEDLKGGSYNIESQLLVSSIADETTGKKYYALHKKCELSDIQMESSDKYLNFECQFDMSYFNQQSEYTLVLKITPHEDIPFREFQGIYTIGDLNFQNVPITINIDSRYDNSYKQLLEENIALKIIEELNIQSLIELKESQNKAQTAPENVPEEDPKYKLHVLARNPQPLGGLAIHRLQLDGHGDYKLSHIQTGDCRTKKENVVTRTVVFIGKVCLKDVLGRHKLEKTPFRVFLEKGTKEKEQQELEYSLQEIFDEEGGESRFYKTDSHSCISIPIELKHKMYDIQRYYSVKIHVYSKDDNLYGQVKLALSPWQRAFQAFQDAQNVPSKAIRYHTEGIDPPELVINQFRSVNLFPSYGLDKLLNIHLFHRVYLLFQPFIRRPDNLALGLDHRSRELLRDGHYLVRVLLLRNPQETGHTPRVENDGSLNANLQTVNQEGPIDITGMEYITHTDSIAKAEANFINFYMPLYLSTHQFLYIASRNLLVVEIYPADPSGFKYDAQNTQKCIVDMKNTDWRKFSSHDLINRPYVGAMNLQNWVNWNLLQPATGENTDSIIERSKIGRKYKHFDFSSTDEDSNREHQDSPPPVRPQEAVGQDSKPSQGACVGGYVTDEKNIEDLQKHIYKQHDNKGASNSSESELPNLDLFSDEDQQDQQAQVCSDGFDGTKPLTATEEEYGQAVADNIEKLDIVKNFAEDNNLRLIDFSEQNGEGETFTRDIEKSFDKLIGFFKGSVALYFDRFNKTYFQMFEELVPEEERQSIAHTLLRVKLLDFCPRSRRVPLSNSAIKPLRECEKPIVSAYIFREKKLSENPDPLFHFFEIAESLELVEKDFWRQRPESCQEFQSGFSCYQYARETIFEIIKTAIDNSFPKRHLLGEILLDLLSSDGKQELFNTYQVGCYQKAFQPPSQYETCYYNKMLELLDQNTYYFYKSLSFSEVNTRLSKENSHQKILQNQVEKLLGDFKWNDILGSILDQSQSFSKKENIYPLIDEGIKESNKNTDDVLAWTKSLCFFWFDSFIKKYLKTEQKIQAYTNFVKKFDYLQMAVEDIRPKSQEEDQIKSFFGDDLEDFLSIMLNETQENNLLSNLGDRTEVGTSCYSNYAQCVLSDYCTEYLADSEQEEYCKKNKDFLTDSSCSVLLQEKCEGAEQLRLCQGDGQSCNSKARAYCQTNSDQKFCAQYANRCHSTYLSCLQGEELAPLFNVDNALNYDPDSPETFPPLETCLKDPFEFFNFENKMMVHDISIKDPQYKGGFLRNFFVSANHSIGSYMNWTAQRGVGVSSGAKLNAGGSSSLPSADMMARGKAFWNFVRLSLGAEVNLGVSQSIGSNTSKSGRRAIDGRVGEGLFLTVGQATIKVGVTKFQNCLVIKPRPNAFTAKMEQGLPAEIYDNVWSESAQQNSFKKVMLSRPGLLLCNPIETRNNSNPKYITEYYYYVAHQVTAENSQFLNLYDLANRPFVMILRGSKEFAKLYYMLRGGLDGKNIHDETQQEHEENYHLKLSLVPPSQFEDYPFPIETAVGLALNMKEFNETGFHLGVYHYSYNKDPLSALFKQDQTNKTLDLLNNNHILFHKVPNSPNTPIAVEPTGRP